MAKKRSNKNRKQVKRQTRHFQLRVEHPIDQHVQEILDFKKSKRAEVTAIRDGVRLLWALENNDLSVLFDMFPHLKPQVGGQGGGGGGDLQEIKSMLEIIAAGRKQGEMVMQSALPPATSKPLVGFKALAAPTFEDDDQPMLDFQRAEGEGTVTSQNFLIMAKGLHATPPKAEIKATAPVSADDIASNFLNQFG